MKLQQYLGAIALATLVGWLAMSQLSDAQAKYQQDVADYEAVVTNDTLPLQARVEQAHPAQQLEDLAKTVQKVSVSSLVAEAKKVMNATALADQLINTAYNYLGVRYRSGHSGPDGFDCSGFTSYVYKQLNLNLTRSSRSQFTEGEPVASVTDLQKGDLVFFGGSRGGRHRVGHVGIVTEVNPDAGTFKFIHASTSSGIKIDDSSEAYYSRRYVGARRILQ